MRRFRRSKIANYIQEFGNETTLHGIPHLIKPKVHYLEKIMWVVIVALSTGGAMSLILNSWNRYNANPTVISLEKDFRDWNLTFPASTACFLNRLNDTLADDYIYEKWGIDPNTTEGEKYKAFLDSVVNLTWANMDSFKNFTDSEVFTSLTGEQLVDIARNVMVEMIFHSNIFNPIYKNISFEPTVTEMGYCYSYSSIVSSFLHFKDQAVVTYKKDLPVCNYLNSLCYARIEDLPTTVKYYIHSPYEIPDVNDKYFVVIQNMERDTSFRFQEMVASEDLRRLDPMQRQCRFVDEPLEGDKFYSYNLCMMNCRKRVAVGLCGCMPYFYIKGDGAKLCDVKGLACLSKYKERIVRLREEDGRRIHCNCLFQCEYTSFYIDKDAQRQWSYPVPSNIRYRWAIEHYSKTRQKRDIIFGFEDLLVSLGGTAAFFLGCSVLSFVELAYFFTLRLFWYIFSK
ncbi:sodium channel protein Nach-like isoform X2 [Cimex lectularius]|uniref:Sodium channel protein Nach n=1 Tax=Cimex lectularius TaxID=79782 RepID=A0A8I6RG38_CIMLE|nr:sodium channel protein Nach-like isoform X2 [Cimex lectularius]